MWSRRRQTMTVAKIASTRIQLHVTVTALNTPLDVTLSSAPRHGTQRSSMIITTVDVSDITRDIISEMLVQQT